MWALQESELESSVQQQGPHSLNKHQTYKDSTCKQICFSQLLVHGRGMEKGNSKNSWPEAALNGKIQAKMKMDPCWNSAIFLSITAYSFIK